MATESISKDQQKARGAAATGKKKSGLRAYLPLALGGLLVLAFAVVAGMQMFAPKGLSVQYATEGGAGVNEAAANSPLKVTLRIPWSDGSFETALAAVGLELLREDGSPAKFGGQSPAEPLAMRATVDIGAWEYTGSVPSEPGTYFARLHLTSLQDTSKVQTYELKDPALVILADTATPLGSGYVFSQDANLWVLATDMSRQRRLTFFDPYYEYAAKPVWSPDGKMIAFTFSPRAAANEIPRTDIWAIDPDGSNARELVKHGPNEYLNDACFSEDGTTLYFSVDTVLDTAPDPNAPPANFAQNRRIDSLELASGTRSQVLPAAQMPACGPGTDMVYLEDVPARDIGGSPGQRLALMPAGASQSTVLIDQNAFPKLYAPHVSPDGKWIVLAAMNVPGPSSSRFDPFAWLLGSGTAHAHDLPWDIYLLPYAGGDVTRLTTMNEDEPYPIWLDNATIAFMGSTGLYKLSITPDGKPAGQAQHLHPGAPHGGLSWHAP